MNNLKIQKRKYNLHRSNNFTLPYKGVFTSWKLVEDNQARILIDEVPFTDYLNSFNIKEIRETIRNILPLNKDSLRSFNLERIIQKEQFPLLDFFPNMDNLTMNSTINNLKLKISFQFKNSPKKVKIIEYYYEMPKSISRPIGEPIDISKLQK